MTDQERETLITVATSLASLQDQVLNLAKYTFKLHDKVSILEQQVNIFLEKY